MQSLSENFSCSLIVALAFLMMSGTACGGVVLDFRERSDATNGWQLVGTSYNADRGCKFAELGACVESPTLTNAITSLVVVTYCSGARVDWPLAVDAYDGIAGWRELSPRIGYVYTTYSTNVFTFAVADNVHRIRIRSLVENEVKGNYYLTCLKARCEGDEPEADGDDGGGDSGGDDDSGTDAGETSGDDQTAGAWMVSDQLSGERREDFAMVTNVVKATPWENGVSIPGFHALKDENPITEIGFDSGKAKRSGLYASYDVDAHHTLSLLAAGTSTVALELHVFNDWREPIGEVLLDYEAWQWTFPAADEHGLEFEWAVTRNAAARPSAEVWQVEADARFASVPPASDDDTNTPRMVTRRLQLRAATVPRGGMLWLRWKVPKRTNCPMFGVGAVGLRFDFLPQPTVLVVR